MRDQAAFELDPTARDIYDVMRRQPGDQFTAQDIAALVGEDATIVSRLLSQLAQQGLITRSSEGADARYVLNDAAPEL